MPCVSRTLVYTAVDPRVENSTLRLGTAASKLPSFAIWTVQVAGLRKPQGAIEGCLHGGNRPVHVSYDADAVATVKVSRLAVRDMIGGQPGSTA